MAYGRYKRKMKRYVKRKMRKYPTYRAVRRIVYNLAETKYWESPMMSIINSSGSPHIISSVIPTANAGYVPQAFIGCSLLNMIAQGTAVNQRIGNRIMVKYIQLTVAVGYSPELNTGSCTCRYVLVQDKSNAGDVAPATSIWSDGPVLAAGVGEPTVSSLKNFNNLKRFRFRLDRQHITQSFSNNPEATTPWSAIQHYVKIGRVIQYQGQNASPDADANFRTNNTLVGSDAFNFYVAGSHPLCCGIKFRWRVAFKDA